MYGKRIRLRHPTAGALRQPGRICFRPLLEQLEGRELLATSVLTYHNDLARSGANLTETVLTHSNVNAATFGKLFSYPVDGYVYAQPLYAPNVTLPDQSLHNIVFVATEHDSVYAFDANDPGAGPNGNGVLWQDSFIDPANGIDTFPSSSTETNDIVPEVGITGTPVIDADRGILYVVASTREFRVVDGRYHYMQKLHALDITTGNEMLGGPVVIADTVWAGADNYEYYVGTSVPGTGAGSVNGVATFNALRLNQRCGLVLANGELYVSWASHGDNFPYHGWVIGYDALTLNQVAVFNTSPNATQGGIWMAGGAPAVDASGSLYLATGNGTFDLAGALSPAYGDSILKLNPSDLSVADYFTPWNQADLDLRDLDQGSAGVLVLPDSVGSAEHPHLMLQVGKTGTIYLIDRDNLGQYQTGGSTSDGVVQVIPNALQGYVVSTPAFFKGMIYIQSREDDLKAYQIAGGQITPIPVSETNQIFSGEEGGTSSISANGTEDGIVWVLDTRGALTGNPVVLHAYNADDLSQELYNTNQAGLRDILGSAVKFTVPTIAEGQVFVGTQNTLEVLGPLSGGPASPRGQARGRAPASVRGAAVPLDDIKSTIAAATSVGKSSTEPVVPLPGGDASVVASARRHDPVDALPAGNHKTVSPWASDRLFSLPALFEAIHVSPLAGAVKGLQIYP